MLFGFFILLLLAAVAYFHYTQGLLSSAISAFAALIAACLALSFHEPLATVLLTGSIPNYVHAASLVVLFGVIYLVLRVLFDKAVSGNVRFPLWVDRIGAGAMGVVAAVYATGILAIATQALPFDASILGYSRYRLMDDREVRIKPARGGSIEQYRDASTSNELAAATIEEADPKNMPIPVDEWVIGTVSFLSRSGSLSGARPLESVHPDYLDELFFNRLGIQTDANRTALNVAGEQQVEVTELHVYDSIAAQADSEVVETRPENMLLSLPKEAGEGRTFLIARVVFDKDASEPQGGLVHLSPAMVRLVVGDREQGWVNVHPVGTLHGGQKLFLNRADDFIFVRFAQGAPKASADLVFLVDKALLMSDPNAENPLVRAGVFLEVKRMGAVDLTDKPIITPQIAALKPDPNAGVLRKADAVTPPPPRKPGSR
jgi:hypothetical protein